MGDVAFITDEDLARARQDPAYRHQLVADSLELLLSEINRLRTQPSSDPHQADQIREGGELAVRLAELLQRVDAADGNPGRGT
jgi:hypothetical protein